MDWTGLLVLSSVMGRIDQSSGLSKTHIMSVSVAMTVNMTATRCMTGRMTVILNVTVTLTLSITVGL